MQTSSWRSLLPSLFRCFFFFNDTATTEIYTLSLHDALPIWPPVSTTWGDYVRPRGSLRRPSPSTARPDRKSTRLNSSHVRISYAVFCLKKKKVLLAVALLVAADDALVEIDHVQHR